MRASRRPAPSRDLTPDEREARLPMWAQQKLKDARYVARNAQEALAAHHEIAEPSRIWHGDYDNRVYIPEPFENASTTVHFDPYNDDEMHHGIQVRIVPKRALYLMTPCIEINTGGQMWIQPVASNLLRVGLAR